MNKEKIPFPELKKALDADPENYRLNVEMGFYYLDLDRKQTYAYLKRALQYCDSQTDYGAIERLFADMEYVYPELMRELDGLLRFFPDDLTEEFTAVALGVGAHGFAHLLEKQYPKAQIVWMGDLADTCARFDAAVTYLVMDGAEMLSRYPAQRLQTLAQVLVPGGNVIFRMPNARYYPRLFSLLTEESGTPDAITEREISYTRVELEALLNENGYWPDIFLGGNADEEAADDPAKARETIREMLTAVSYGKEPAPIEEFMMRDLLVRATRVEE